MSSESTATAGPYRTCTGAACGKPMRRRGIAKELAPGTVAEGHGGRCKACCNADRKAEKQREQIKVVPDPITDAPAGDKESAERHLMSVVSLDAYFRSRGRRGQFADRINQSLPSARRAFREAPAADWAPVLAA